MAKVKLEKDLLEPHPTREGAFHLVARKGDFVDERVVAAVNAGKPAVVPAEGLVSSESLKASEPVAATEGEGYEAMKVAELRDLAAERGIDHDGLKKAELVEALEDADEA
jgi:hypothetical protein